MGKSRALCSVLVGCCKAPTWGECPKGCLERCPKGCPKGVSFSHLQRWELRATECSWMQIKVFWRKASAPTPYWCPLFSPPLQLYDAPWPWDSHGGAQMELGGPGVFAAAPLYETHDIGVKAGPPRSVPCYSIACNSRQCPKACRKGCIHHPTK